MAKARDINLVVLLVLTCIAFVSAMSVSNAVAQTVAYVAHDAAGAGTLADPTDPFPSFTDALAAGADELRVKIGTYTENVTVSSGDVDFRTWNGVAGVGEALDVGASVIIEGTLRLGHYSVESANLTFVGEGVTFAARSITLENGTLNIGNNILDHHATHSISNLLFIRDQAEIVATGSGGKSTPTLARIRETGPEFARIFFESLNPSAPTLEVDKAAGSTLNLESIGNPGENTVNLQGMTILEGRVILQNSIGTLNVERFFNQQGGRVRLNGADLNVAQNFFLLDGDFFSDGGDIAVVESYFQSGGDFSTFTGNVDIGGTMQIEAGGFGTLGGDVITGGDFFLGPQQGTQPGNALFSLLLNGEHIVVGDFVVGPDTDPNSNDPDLHNTYRLGGQCGQQPDGGGLYANGRVRLDGSGDRIDDGLWLPGQQGLQGNLFFSGPGFVPVQQRQDEDAFFCDVVMQSPANGGIILESDVWINEEGSLTLETGIIDAGLDNSNIIVLNPGFETDLVGRNNSTRGNGVVDLGSRDSYINGEVDRRVEFATTDGGGIVTGGYLFPVGAEGDSSTGRTDGPVAQRDVDFFRPLILQFPDDLGRSSIARVEYSRELAGDDFSFPPGGIDVPADGGGTLTLDTIGDQFWRLEFDEVPDQNPNVRLELDGVLNINDNKSMRALQWECDGSNPRLLGVWPQGEDDPVDDGDAVINAPVDGVDNLTQVDVNVELCQYIGIASDSAINPIGDAGEPPVAEANTEANHDGAANTIDPISTLTGELFFLSDPDLFLQGPMSVAFCRYYGSLMDRDGRVQSSLGPNWSHPYDARIRHLSATEVEFVTAKGRVTPFENQGGDWVQTGNMDRPYWMENPNLVADPRTKHTFAFDNDGLLTAISDTRGNTLTVNRIGDLIDRVEDGFGRRIEFTHNVLDQLTEVTDGIRTVTYTYDNAGMLSTVTDASGAITTYAYDPAHAVGGLLVSETRPEGNTPYVQTYDGLGRVVAQTDALGGQLTLVYGANQTTITDALGNSFVHTYSDDGLLTSFSDTGGRRIMSEYDAFGRRNRIVDRLGGTTTFNFDPDTGLPLLVTEANGATTTFVYSQRVSGPFEFDDLTQVNLPNGSSVGALNDANGNPTQISDPDGGTWHLTYNALGQITSSTNPSGGTSTTTFDVNANLSSLTDPIGNTTSYHYDALHRLTRIDQADATRVNYTYDEFGRVLSFTEERGALTELEYDQNGNVLREIDPVGTTFFDYDALDRIIRQTDRQGNSILYTYDAANRRVSRTDRNGAITAYGYDADGRLTSTSQAGKTTSFSFDAEGVGTSATNPEGETVGVTSNSMGWPTRFTSPEGSAVNTTYDALGRLLSVADPGGGLTSFQLDNSGRRISTTLPGSARATYQYDGMGGVISVVDPNNGPWLFGRDNLGRITSRTDPSGQRTDYVYDSMHRVVRKDLPGGLGSVVSAYDNAGNLISRSADAVNTVFQYDELNRLTGGTGFSLSLDVQGRVTESNGLLIGRAPGGRIISVTYPAGVVDYSYDALDRLIRVEDWTGGMTTFEYDDADRVTEIHRPNTVHTVFQYDDNGLVREKTDFRSTGGPDVLLASHVLTRDARGFVANASRNTPTSPILEEGARNWTYNENSESEQRTYDAFGRLLTSDTKTVTWNGLSQLTRFTQSQTDVSFTYDGLGLVISETESSVTRESVWNYATNRPTLAIEKEGSQDILYHIYTPDGCLLYSIEVSGGAKRYYVYDELGNVVLVTDDAGNVIASYSYSPFGEILASSGAVDNRFTWQGKYGVVDHTEIGLGYYMQQRYYSPWDAQFISRDPVASTHPAQMNPYVYAANNPVRFIDPTGEAPQSGQSAPDWADKAGAVGLGFNTTVGGTNGLAFRTYVSPLFGIQGTLGFHIISADIESGDGSASGERVSWRAAPNDPSGLGLSMFSVGIYATYKIAYWQRGSLSVIFGGDVQSISSSVDAFGTDDDPAVAATSVLLGLGLQTEYFPTQYLSLFTHASIPLDFLGNDDFESLSGGLTGVDPDVSGIDVALGADVLGAAGVVVWFK